MEQRFGGMMEKQSHTLAGLFSTFKDTFTQISGTVMTPFVDLATKGMDAISGKLPAIQKGVSDFVAKLGDAGGVVGKLGVVFDAVTGLADKAWEALKAAFNRIDWGAVWSVVASALAKIPDLVAGLVSALAAMATRVFEGLKHAWDAIQWGQVWDVVVSALKKVPDLAAALLTDLGRVAAGILDALLKAVRGVPWAELGRTIGDLLVGQLNNIARFVNQVDWNNVGKQLVAGVEMVIVGLARFLASVDWPAVLVSIGRGIVAVLRGLGGLLLGIAEVLGGQIVTGLVRGLGALKDKVGAAMSGLGGLIRSGFSAALSGLEAIALKIALNVVEPFSHMPARLGGWARDAKKEIQAQLSSISTKNVGTDAAAQGAAKGAAFGAAFKKAASSAFSSTTVTGLPAQMPPGSVPAPPSLGVTTPTGGSNRIAATAVNAAGSPGAAAASFHLPGERTPYDCSAFVQAVFANNGIPNVGSTTYTQITHGRHVDLNDLLPGDVIFFNYGSETWPGHVGIYVGNGMMVHDHGASRGVQEQSYASLAGSSNHTPEARCFIDSHQHAGAKKAGSPLKDQGPSTADAGATAPSAVAPGTTTKKAAAKAATFELSGALEVALASAREAITLHPDSKKAQDAFLQVLRDEVSAYTAAIKSGKWKGKELADLIEARTGVEKDIQDILSGRSKAVKVAAQDYNVAADPFMDRGGYDKIVGDYARKAAAAAKKAADEARKQIADALKVAQPGREAESDLKAYIGMGVFDEDVAGELTDKMARFNTLLAQGLKGKLGKAGVEEMHKLFDDLTGAAKDGGEKVKAALQEQWQAIADSRQGLQNALSTARDFLSPKVLGLDTITDALPKITEAWQKLGQGFVPEEARKAIEAQLKDLNSTVDTALGALTERVRTAKDDVAKAWDAFATHVLSVFDEKVVGALQRSFDELANLFDDKRNQQKLDDAMKSLNALAFSDPKTADLVRRRIDLWKQYYQAVSDGAIDTAKTLQDSIIKVENEIANRDIGGSFADPKLVREVADAQADLAAAIAKRSAAAVGANTATLDKAVREAQEKVDDLTTQMGASQDANAKALSDRIVASGDVIVTGIQKTGADMLAAAIKRWQDLEAPERDAILATIKSAQDAVDTGQILLPEALERVKAALTAAGMSEADADSLIHDPIANSLSAAITALQSAIADLTTAMTAIAAALGAAVQPIGANATKAAKAASDPWVDAAGTIENATARIASAIGASVSDVAAFVQANPEVAQIIAGEALYPGSGIGAYSQYLTGGKAGTYDSGGYLPMGWSLAGNFTGSPEPVGANTGGGDTIVNFNGPVYGADADELARGIRDRMRELDRRDTGGRVLSSTPALR
jgi:cell wall-associated NlpC family hydrolase